MKLIDIINGPWAITPEMLTELVNIYKTHMRGDKIDIESVEAKIGRPLNNEREHVNVVDGVAIIPVHGVIAKRMNLFQKISGGASTELIAEDIRAAIDDPDVRAVVLDVDSPGGTVDGTFQLAEKIYNMRGDKPIVSWANGLMASAAYAIGSAADQIYSADQTTVVGSIGVIATHVDYSEYEKKMGIKTTEIYAGKYKRIVSDVKPLSKEGREFMQSHVDYLYSVFVDNVSKFRGVPVSTVLDDMADARLFIGQQAVDAGLVDGVSTLEGLIAALSDGELPAGNTGSAAAETESITAEVDAGTDVLSTMSEETDMPDKQEITKGYIEENHPDIADAFRQEGHEKGRKEGAEAETARVKAVQEQTIPGHEALIEQMMFDGKTTGEQAAVQVLKAEKSARDKAVATLEEDAAETVDQPATTETATKPKVDPNLPLEERCKQEWEQQPELRDEFSSLETYTAFKRAEEGGQVRVLRK